MKTINTNKVLQYFGWLLLVTHFLFIGVNNINILKKHFNQEHIFEINIIDKYCQLPYANQRWHMFSPPPKTDFKVLYQFTNNQDTTQWYDATSTLFDLSKNNLNARAKAACYSSMLFYSIQNILVEYSNFTNDNEEIEVFHERLNKISSHQNLMSYGNQIYLNSDKIKSIIGVENIQLRYKIVRIKISKEPITSKDIFCIETQFTKSIKP